MQIAVFLSADFTPALEHVTHLLAIHNTVLRHCISLLYLLTPPSSLGYTLFPKTAQSVHRILLFPTVSWTKAVTSFISQHSLFALHLCHFAVPSLKYHGSRCEIMEALCGCWIPKACGALLGPLPPSCGPQAEVVENKWSCSRSPSGRYLIAAAWGYVSLFGWIMCVWKDLVCFSGDRLRKAHCVARVRKTQIIDVLRDYIYLFNPVSYQLH